MIFESGNCLQRIFADGSCMALSGNPMVDFQDTFEFAPLLHGGPLGRRRRGEERHAAKKTPSPAVRAGPGAQHRRMSVCRHSLFPRNQERRHVAQTGCAAKKNCERGRR